MTHPFDDRNAVRVHLAGEHNGVFELVDGADPALVEVVGRSSTTRDILREVRAFEPNVLIVNETSAEIDSRVVLRRLRRLPQTRTILLVAEDTDLDVRETVALGAAGVLHPRAPAKLVVKCIRLVARGEFWFPRDLTRALVDSLPGGGRRTRSSSRVAVGDRLTPRETDVMQAVARGKTNREIALELSMSEHTVKQHLKQVFGKLDVSSRVELVLRVARRAR